MKSSANKRGAGKGGFAVLWRAGRAWPALPDRERSALHTLSISSLLWSVCVWRLSTLRGRIPTRSTIAAHSLASGPRAERAAPENGQMALGV
jgi:hypothetical protein